MSYLAAIENIEPDKTDIPEALTDIKEAIKFLVETAHNLIPEGITKERAYAYWYPHILNALDEDNVFIGRSMCQLQDTIEELE